MTAGQDRPAPLTVRPAAPEDLDALQALARRTIDARYRAFLGDEAVDWFVGSGASDAHVKNHLERGGVHCLRRGDRIVGLSILDGPTVDLMMVDPEHHGRGLGLFLLRHAEETLLARYATVRLETFTANTTAVAFYEACGWHRGEPLEGEGPDRVEYTRSRTEG
ncbi:GNAT family N-acetyltransferase [Streptomyces sp. NPDC127049]|uniref:GNAT family N-acetyltransferase n=1 Tax=Streptomyces sp. NPDC127049 TaxID=3347118 RepID=UPI003662CEDB